MRNCVIHILYGERGEGGKKWINTANGRAWERRGQRMCLPEYRCRWYHGGGRCYGRCWGWKNWRTRWWSTSSRGTVNSIINDKSSSLVVYYPSIGILRIANEREKRIFHPWSMIYNEKKEKEFPSNLFHSILWMHRKESTVSKFYWKKIFQRQGKFNPNLIHFFA